MCWLGVAVEIPLRVCVCVCVCVCCVCVLVFITHMYAHILTCAEVYQDVFFNLDFRKPLTVPFVFFSLCPAAVLSQWNTHAFTCTRTQIYILYYTSCACTLVHTHTRARTRTHLYKRTHIACTSHTDENGTGVGFVF